MILTQWNKHRHIGLLILRIGIGVMFMIHGYPKLMGGPETWAKIGSAMQALGVDFVPTFMGFMAAISEFGGGLLIIFGLFMRPACFFLLMTMVVATAVHLKKGDPFSFYSHPLEAGILFFSLLFIGPGKISLDHKFAKPHKLDVP